MDPLLLLAIEADREAKRKSEPVCHADNAILSVKDSISNLNSSFSGIEAAVTELAKEVSAIGKAAVQKPQEAVQLDYEMDVIRGKDDRINKIYVKSIPKRIKS